MNLYINIYFSMLISSSTLLLLFVSVMHFSGDIFTQRYRYVILKMSLIMGILPIAYIKLPIGYIMKHIIPHLNQDEFFIPGKLQAIMITPQGFYSNMVYKNNMIITKVWFGMTLMIFVWYLYKYIRFRKWILSTVHEPEQATYVCLIERYREKLHIKRKVKIYIAASPVSPFTVGIIRPLIIVPDSLDFESLELIIHHELCHIKRNDMLIRFLRIIIVGIYWFNPLVYILDSYLEEHCESACDELVTETLNKESKRKYGNLIIDMASLNISGAVIYITPFSRNNDKNNIKKRMELIMRNDKKKSKLALLLSVGMVLCSSFTAFAYEGPQSIIFIDQPTNDVYLENTSQTICFKTNLYSEEGLVCESQFTDKDGNIYRVGEEKDTRAKKCDHTFIDGQYEKHTKNKDKSCVTKVYSAQRCTKCGGLKIGSLITTVTSTFCTH